VARPRRERELQALFRRAGAAPLRELVRDVGEERREIDVAQRGGEGLDCERSSAHVRDLHAVRGEAVDLGAEQPGARRRELHQYRHEKALGAPEGGAGIAREAGSLAPGKRADVLVLDRRLRVRRVFIGGAEFRG
jgi:hypothetical protein